MTTKLSKEGMAYVRKLSVRDVVNETDVFLRLSSAGIVRLGQLFKSEEWFDRYLDRMYEKWPYIYEIYASTGGDEFLPVLSKVRLPRLKRYLIT